jgi:hypothetical protein
MPRGVYLRPPKQSPESRFWAKVQKTDGCWLWVGSRMGSGYGQFGYAAGDLRMAHRMAYEFVKGTIPDGLDIDHLCRNRSCVKPDHLEAVTHRENMVRGETFAARNATKTHCKNGHPLSGSNLINQARGDRVCRICANARVRELKRTNPEYKARCKEALRLWKQKKRHASHV